MYRQLQQILFAPSSHAACSARLIKFVVVDGVCLSIFNISQRDEFYKKKILDWIFVIVD
jgi:hypothetical protein